MDLSKIAAACALSAALLGCGETAEEPPLPAAMLPAGSYVELKREAFQKTVDGKPCDLFTIRSERGSFARITNYGAKIVQLVVPDRDGQYGDVVIGYESLDAVMSGQASAGAFMGRYTNRISGGTFKLDGVEYKLPQNDGSRPNTVHGGPRGARFRVFDAAQVSESVLKMNYVFTDGEEGFPGTLALSVTYSMSAEGALHVDYSATALDKKTVFNFTSHPFFNLSNSAGSTALDHVVTVNADRVLEIDKNLIPTGVLRDITGTPLDFRAGKALGRDLEAPYDLLMRAGGYDHTFVLNKSAEGRLGFVARVFEPTSGRWLEIFSTEPGMQLFSGNGFAAKAPIDLGKGGVLHPKHSGIALEPMHFPDSPNQPSFPSTILEAGETYRGEIIFRFGTRSGAPI